MRRLMVSEFITLDGIVEAPGGEPGHPHSGWVFDYHGPALEEYKLDEIDSASAMLLGRVTYEGFAEAWPSRTGPLADRLNSLPKYVVSSTLAAPLDWSNTTLLTGDLVTVVDDLKRSDGGPIMVHGSARLVRSLLAAGLVDDLRLMVFPVTVGGGGTIFPGDFVKSTFTLAASDVVLPNVVALTYRRVERSDVAEPSRTSERPRGDGDEGGEPPCSAHLFDDARNEPAPPARDADNDGRGRSDAGSTWIENDAR